MTLRHFKPTLAGMNWYRDPEVEIVCMDNRRNAERFSLPESAYFCRCNTHGAQVYSRCFAEAMHDMNHPDEWCVDCAQVLAEVLRAEREQISHRAQRKGRGR